MKKYRPHILVLCVLAVVLLSGVHTALQSVLTDKRFNWFPRPATGAIVLVAIDSPSIEKIGVWPWPRELHAHLMDRLTSAGATDIVFDVDFSSASNPASDRAFADALKRAGGSVVLPAFKQLAPDGNGGRTIHINRPLPEFAKQSWSAVVNVAVERDGLVRRYPFGETLDQTFLPSVGALLAGKYATKREPLTIDYSIKGGLVPTVSYVDVLRSDPAALKEVKGKRVVIGATAIELGDRFNVPNGAVISGPILQILAAESILQDREMRPASMAVMLGGLTIILLLMAGLWSRLSALKRVVLLAGMAAAIEAGAIYLQATTPVSLDTSLFHIAIAAYLAAMALDEIDFRDLLGSIAERRFHRIAMSLGDGLVCTGPNGLITVWNPGAVAIFGYTPEEMIGRPLDGIWAGKGVLPSFATMPLTDLQAPGGKIMEIEGRRKNGDVFPLEACFSQWQGVDGVQYGAVMRDISVRKREAERIRYLAEHDSLTGLANRNKLHEQLDKSLADAKAKQCEVALLMLDLDKFKQINDTQGHACGDRLLRDVADRLTRLVGDAGLVARLSGDEFAVVMSDDKVMGAAQELLRRLSTAFSETEFSVGTRELRINTSIGVAIYPKDCVTAEELLGNADLALYQAKAAGRGRAVFFHRSIRDELEQRLALEVDLERALERGEFELYYQPQVNLKDGSLAGAEALIRWRHSHRGLVLPKDFISTVNSSAFSNDVALWVMDTACRQGKAWQQSGHGIRIGVNLSASQFQTGDLSATVAGVLGNTGLSPSLLELEVTESILLEDDERALEIFGRIQSLGVHIAFDDFGTGFASLTYLKKFPLDRLKIDQSFVRKLTADSDDMAIVGATIGLGKQLGMSVIAEGIEDAATADLLASRGCEEGQGYHFGRPMPADEFARRFLSGETPLVPDSYAEAESVSAA
ncbi:MAG: EAL domain-containing protein [Pseudolabrys sp.]